MADTADAAHIVLVGMMGSGKTTVGRRVAKHLNRPFIDADEELESVHGMSVADWFSERGEDAFRDAEAELLAAMLANPEPSVIATGGGVVLQPSSRALLQSNRCTVVWLRAAPKFLADRLAAKAPKANRPLLRGDIHERMRTFDAQRRSLYASVADVIIDIEPVHRGVERPKKELAAIVINALAEYTNSAIAPTTTDRAHTEETEPT